MELVARVWRSRAAADRSWFLEGAYTRHLVRVPLLERLATVNLLTRQGRCQEHLLTQGARVKSWNEQPN